MANAFYTEGFGKWLCLRMTVDSLTAGVETIFEGTAPVGDKANFEGTGDELFPHMGGIPAAAVLSA